MSQRTTRRDFVRTAVASAAALATASCETSVQSAIRRGANGRLQFGIIGFGVRARELYNGFLDDAGVEIVQIADACQARADEGARLVNERRKAVLCKAVPSWREMLGSSAIDGVIIATPDHWHAEPAIVAAKAGKHIYCEKPMSLTIAEGRAMADAARKAGICFQTGSQQRSEFGHFFVRAAEAVRNGRIGTVKRITIGIGEPPIACNLPEEPLPEGIDWDAWLGQAPMRPFHHDLCPIGMHNHYPSWRKYREYANGGLADMGAHHFDIAQWALNMDGSGPRKVIPPTDGTLKGLRFVYANGVEMVHGGPTDCTFEGTEGTIECSRGHIKAFRGTDRSGPDAPELLAEPVRYELRLPRNASHTKDFLGAIREGRDPICTAETGHRTATICQLAVIGYDLRKPLTWDPANETFVGENAAEGNAHPARSRAARPHR